MIDLARRQAFIEGDEPQPLTSVVVRFLMGIGHDTLDIAKLFGVPEHVVYALLPQDGK